DDLDDAHRVFQRLGGVELARTSERLDDLIRLDGEMRGWGYETQVLGADETIGHLPFLDPAAIVGSLFVAKSGLVKGYHAVGDLLRRAGEHGVRWFEETGLRGIEIEDGTIAAITTSNPAVGRIACDVVVLAANIWSPELARHFGLDIPLMAFEHQYAITPSLDEWGHYDPADIDHEVTFPLVRDTDAAMYYRKHWSALGIGSYAHGPLAVRSRNVGDTAMREFTPEDFGDAWKLAQDLIPMLRHRRPEFETAFNGMFAFSVDGMPIIGESRHVAGLWSANASWITHAGGVAKSAAEWIATGETEWDMRSCHLYRFPPHATTDRYIAAVTSKNYREVYDIVHPKQPLTEPRDVRLTPFHQRHLDADAVFTTFAGFELPNWYESNADLLEQFGDQVPDRRGWAGAYWSRIQGAEHLAVRHAAGLFDLTGLSIIEVAGPGACDFSNYLCSNNVDVPVGRVVYTCWLTESGGVRRDLAVVRLEADRFWMFVGEGSLPMDLDWVARHAPPGISVRDRSAEYSAVGVFGPAARDILQQVSAADLSSDAFGYYTGAWIEVGMSPVYAMRISYVGELGWELHIPVDSSLNVWDSIVGAGAAHGLRLAGQGAMDSLRLEKGYRLWGADVHTEYDVYEAGLGWTAKLSKTDFVGRSALVTKEGMPPGRRLSCLTLDDSAATLLGYEPVFSRDQPVGYITTANRGYSVGSYVAYAYLPADLAVPGTPLEVQFAGERYAAIVATEPLFDPKMERTRS
ncbi:MAG: FAD-dependent oxidoreductase, partial [Acidimicrobiia bacterium]|nr:FAD-dependent oxidoreductase [Acidimicrobiia bacterium]